MRAKAFKEFLKSLPRLTYAQREIIEDALKETEQDKDVCQLIDEEESKLGCPHCASEVLQKWGIVNQLQRYRCKACRKTFNRLSNTPFSRLRKKEKWQGVITSLKRGESITQMSESLGVKRETAFRWRHRFLEGFARKEQGKLGGIVEADETFFRQSEKGNRRLERKPRKRAEKASTPGLSQEDFVTVWIARDRQKVTLHQVTYHRDAYFIQHLLGGKIVPESILCTDGKKGYAKFARKHKIQHIVLNASNNERVKESVYHIQNVNNYQARLKNWMGRFNGVATHYLQNYLQWFKLIADISEKLIVFEPSSLLKMAILNI